MSTSMNVAPAICEQIDKNLCQQATILFLAYPEGQQAKSILQDAHQQYQDQFVSNEGTRKVVQHGRVKWWKRAQCRFWRALFQSHLCFGRIRSYLMEKNEVDYMNFVNTFLCEEISSIIWNEVGSIAFSTF